MVKRCHKCSVLAGHRRPSIRRVPSTRPRVCRAQRVPGWEVGRSTWSENGRRRGESHYPIGARAKRGACAKQGMKTGTPEGRADGSAACRDELRWFTACFFGHGDAGLGTRGLGTRGLGTRDSATRRGTRRRDDVRVLATCGSVHGDVRRVRDVRLRFGVARCVRHVRPCPQRAAPFSATCGSVSASLGASATCALVRNVRLSSRRRAT
jgi:hypothetical protein